MRLVCFGLTIIRNQALLPIILLVGTLSAFAQTAAPTPTAKPDEDAPVVQPTAKADSTPKKSDAVRRWVEIDGLSFSTRYRFIETRSGATTNQAQFQVNARARFKFDSKGKYSVYAGLFTGSNLTSGWNNTGWGTGDGQGDLHLKQLYFNAKPTKWLEVQFGGIGGYNGEHTEITGLDNDVYLTGERVQIRRPKNLYFDEISYTSAFIGDILTPSVFRRFDRLDEWNYHQITVRKQISKQVGFSAEYAYEAGRHLLRQAVNVKTTDLTKLLDKATFENYQVIDPNPGYGFALHGEKKLHKRFTLGGGFARIDQPLFNADRFPTGNRLFVTTNTKLSREFTLSSALIQAVGPLPLPSTPRTRLDIILTYNLLETLRRTRYF